MNPRVVENLYTLTSTLCFVRLLEENQLTEAACVKQYAGLLESQSKFMLPR